MKKVWTKVVFKIWPWGTDKSQTNKINNKNVDNDYGTRFTTTNIERRDVTSTNKPSVVISDLQGFYTDVSDVIEVVWLDPVDLQVRKDFAIVTLKDNDTDVINNGNAT